MVNHPVFRAGKMTTGFLEQYPELFEFRRRRDRATQLLSYVGHVIVNGNETVKGCPQPEGLEGPAAIPFEHGVEPRPGTR
jgi:pyruvate carboxylase